MNTKREKISLSLKRVESKEARYNPLYKTIRGYKNLKVVIYTKV